MCLPASSVASHILSALASTPNTRMRGQGSSKSTYSPPPPPHTSVSRPPYLLSHSRTEIQKKVQASNSVLLRRSLRSVDISQFRRCRVSKRNAKRGGLCFRSGKGNSTGEDSVGLGIGGPSDEEHASGGGYGCLSTRCAWETAALTMVGFVPRLHFLNEVAIIPVLLGMLHILLSRFLPLSPHTTSALTSPWVQPPHCKMESKLAWRSNHGVTPLHLLGSVHKYIGAWSFFRRDNISENRQEPLRCGLFPSLFSTLSPHSLCSLSVLDIVSNRQKNRVCLLCFSSSIAPGFDSFWFAAQCYFVQVHGYLGVATLLFKWWFYIPIKIRVKKQTERKETKERQRRSQHTCWRCAVPRPKEEAYTYTRINTGEVRRPSVATTRDPIIIDTKRVKRSYWPKKIQFGRSTGGPKTTEARATSRAMW
ncbi:hypothetical protein L1049_001583 [Liquidambar formosana]|uniref:Uncharacterized protein n=1 Tax=Liquidambar formosana TaxID=63359 RepID=A0AAP0R5L1_LIQFO